MKHRFVIFIAAVLAVILIAYMFCFQVRYNEVAVRTTFGSATESSIITTSGLKMRWPWPVQRVQKYDTRLRILEDQLEQFQTADGYSVIVRMYAGQIEAMYTEPAAPGIGCPPTDANEIQPAESAPPA